MIAITRFTKQLLAGSGPGRYELFARKDFRPACRWAEMLGFQIETPTIKNYYHGVDFVGYTKHQE